MNDRFVCPGCGNSADDAEVRNLVLVFEEVDLLERPGRCWTEQYWHKECYVKHVCSQAHVLENETPGSG